MNMWRVAFRVITQQCPNHLKITDEGSKRVEVKPPKFVLKFLSYQTRLELALLRVGKSPMGVTHQKTARTATGVKNAAFTVFLNGFLQYPIHNAWRGVKFA